MKFMKLGSKPDVFHSDGNVMSVFTDLSSDIVVDVNGARFLLHKFPLLSKSGRFHKMIVEAREQNRDEIQLDDFPGGVESFTLCAKFCYGITITLNAYNVVAVRCGAENLEMTETIEKGNLIFKLEVFLNSSIFRSWKDSIITLQSTRSLLPWAEDLKIISRCVDSIASKTSVDPSKVEWSYTYTRANAIEQITLEKNGSPPWNNGHQSRRHQAVPKDWWVEDICELDVEMYWRVMMAIKAKGRMSHELIGEAIRFYTYRWLPGISKDQNSAEGKNNGNGAANSNYGEATDKHRLLVETVVSLLPPETGSTSCVFLLKLLKAAAILDAASSLKTELAKRIGLQLEEASLNDLLIPSISYTSESLYDVDLVQQIVEYFLSQDQSPPRTPNRENVVPDHHNTRSAENLDFSETRRSATVTHSSKLKVAKLVDGYLAEIARDTNLPLSKFISLAESIPDFARPVHDGIYRAIDIYLKEHPGLSKTERKKLCRLMDCKRLSMDACMHAAQNERLPLRVVVQVLFFEQVRSAVSGGLLLNDLPSSVKELLPAHDETTQSSGTNEDGWEGVHHDFRALKGDLATMKQRIEEAERERTQMQKEVMKHNMKSKGLISNSRRIFSKLFQNKEHSETSKSSDTSKSSESPVSTTNSSTGKLSAARQRRLSMS